MRILVFTLEGSPPFRISGPTRVAFHLTKEFDKKEVEVDYVFGVSKDHFTKIKDFSNFFGFSEKVNLTPIVRSPLSSNSHFSAFDTALFKDILNFFKKSYDKYNLVHFFNTPNSKEILVPFIARLRKIPTVYTAHGWTTYERFYGNKSKYDYFSNRILEKSFAKIVCVSFWIKKKLILDGIGEQKLKVVHNGVDLETFRNARKIELIGNPVLLYVGRLEYVKGVDMLVRSMKRLKTELPEAILHVVGQGSLKASLQNYIKENNLRNVILHNFIPDQTLPSYYNSSDICIFPSRYEPCSLAILEALAAGKPVVASRVGGIPEIVNNLENAILIDPSVKVIEDSICSLWNSKSLTDKIRRNNLEKASKYDWKNVANKYIEVYEQLSNR